MLKSTKKVQNWNQKDLPEEERKPFYTWIARDKEIVKSILLLTGSIQGTRNKINFVAGALGASCGRHDDEEDSTLPWVQRSFVPQSGTGTHAKLA